MRYIRRFYGARPLHLLSLLACFTFAGYVVTLIHQAREWQLILLWFAGAIIGHDIVAFPLYALADRSAGLLAARRHPDRLPAVPWINHIRVPAVVSGLLLAICFPLVLNLAGPSYQAATGLSVAPFAGRYLLIVAVLFGTSAVLYSIRVRRVVRRHTPISSNRPPPSGT